MKVRFSDVTSYIASVTKIPVFRYSYFKLYHRIIYISTA